MDEFTRKPTDIHSSNLSNKLLLISQELSYILRGELLDVMSIAASRMDSVSIELKISYMHLLITYASFLSVADKISLVNGGLYDENSSDHMTGLANKALSSMRVVSNLYKSKALHAIKFCDDISTVHALIAEIEIFVREIVAIVDAGILKANLVKSTSS